MSYGAYGGFAFRNGVLVPERSDVFFKSNGELCSTPGRYPPHVCPELFANKREVFHVLLGDAPIFVALNKGALVTRPALIEAERWGYIQRPGEAQNRVNIRGALLTTLAWEDPDEEGGDFGILARLEQNGVIWSGFCGVDLGPNLNEDKTARANARLRAWLAAL